MKQLTFAEEHNYKDDDDGIPYFAKYPNLPRNLLGRQGWLRNLKLAVIDYDNLLYLPAPGILHPQPQGLGGDERRSSS